MPRTDAQVNGLLDQLRSKRNQLDVDLEASALAKEATATRADNDAANTWTDILTVLQSRKADRALGQDTEGLDVQYRVLSAQHGRLQQEAEKERMNARRLRSLNHLTEQANDAEICLACRIHHDDNGDVIAASHKRHSIEDTVGVDTLGNPVTMPGLRTLFKMDRANINDQGNLEIDGVEVK